MSWRHNGVSVWGEVPGADQSDRHSRKLDEFGSLEDCTREKTAGFPTSTLVTQRESPRPCLPMSIFRPETACSSPPVRSIEPLQIEQDVLEVNAAAGGLLEFLPKSQGSLTWASNDTG